MSQVTLRRAIPHLGLLQIAIIVLAVVTGLVHLDRAITMSLLAGHAPGHPGGFPNHPGGPPPGGHMPGPSIGFSLLSLIPVPLTTLFYLNFAGYIVLATALYLPQLLPFQRVIRWLLIAFAAVTVVAWFLITGAQPNLLAYIDKPIELALIVLLLIDDWQARSESRVSRG
jgi:hypothetical protein